RAYSLYKKLRPNSSRSNSHRQLCNRTKTRSKALRSRLRSAAPVESPRPESSHTSNQDLPSYQQTKAPSTETNAPALSSMRCSPIRLRLNGLALPKEM
ncbi:uncharacterized protein K452DRAFT_9173, partial [Aplosporella prunicola CBS 121167]